jgi:hypothetical protein
MMKTTHSTLGSGAVGGVEGRDHQSHQVWVGLGLAALAARIVYQAGVPVLYMLFELSAWVILAFVLRLISGKRLFAHVAAAGVADLVVFASLQKQAYIGRKLVSDDVQIFWQDPGLILQFMSVGNWLRVGLCVAVLIALWAWERRARIARAELVIVGLALAQSAWVLGDPDKIWRHNCTAEHRNLTVFVGSLFNERKLDTVACHYKSLSACAESDPHSLKPVATQGRHPHVIAILLESTFDLSRIQGVSGWDQLWAEQQPAPMRVYVKGGNTWVEEYALLHGVPPPAYGPHFHSIQMLGPGTLHGRLAPGLKAAGYQSTSILGYRKDYYQSGLFQKSLGIDQILDCDDLKACSDNFELRDDAVFSAILHEAQSDAPRFVYATTMSNHSPHANKVPDPQIRCDQQIGGPACDVLNDYYSRERRLRARIVKLVQGLQRLPHDSVVLFFGDHVAGDVVKHVPRERFAGQDDMQTLFFMYDTAQGKFSIPAALKGSCSKAFAFESADLDAILMHGAGFDSPYIQGKLDRIRAECTR